MIVNSKLNAAIGKEGVGENAVVEDNVRIMNVILKRSKAPNVPVGVPLMAFVKNAGGKFAIMDLDTGSVQILEAVDIRSAAVVKGDFSLHGVTYKMKDTINGYKRYRPVIEADRPRQKKIEVEE